MNNRIDLCFDALKSNGKKALITFVTAGDPDMKSTEEIVLSMFENGADIVELGVPFSDPIAESSTIQKASLRSLANGTTLDMIFDLVKILRQKTDKPLLLMMYLNTLFVYGKERFFKNCKDAQIDGVIVPDMPFEERNEIIDYAQKHGIYSINFVTSTSHGRITTIASNSNGFLYCLPPLEVTGTETEFKANLEEFFSQINKNPSCPSCVGLEVSTPEQAGKMSKYCDGVIVGDAIVKIIEEFGENSADKVGKFVKKLKDAI